MITIHRIVENKNGRIEIDLPDEIKTEKLDVTISTMDETEPEEKRKQLRELYGAINLKISVEEIGDELRKLRSEWDRDIV